MENPPDSASAAITAATEVLDRHFAALNAGDAAAVAQTLHFPHYRLAGITMQVWEGPENYLADFRKRAGDGWHHSQWDFREAFAASADKVHFDVRFTRYRVDNTVMGCYRSLWIVSRIDGRWAAQLRSSFAD
ncbi:MAG TPA: hypothetical protein VEX61_11240 [Burkholderiales bacterium]|nr:hypothetical protein [Burkholderiales bacterium]